MPDEGELQHIGYRSAPFAQYCSLAARWGIYLILLAVPLIFYSDAFWPFDIPKVTILRVLTIMVILAHLTGMLASRELRFIRPPVLFPILIYLAVFCLSTIFSISHNLSLFGGGGRNMGLISLANMIALYFLATNIITRRKHLLRCLQILLLSASIVAIIGILQYYGIAYSIISDMMGDRASSTFGNPDFLFSFLVLPIPIALGYVLKRRLQYLVPLSLLVFCLILSMPSLSSRVSSDEDPMIDQVSSYFSTTAWSPDSDRLSIVNIALDTIPDHPILGSGPSTFRNTFTQHSTIEYTITKPDQRQDKTHNAFVEAASTTGILGLLSYIFALAAIIWFFIRWLRNNQRNRDSVFVTMILLSTILYIGQSLLIFHTTIPYTFFWLLLAIGMGLCCDSHVKMIIKRINIPEAVSYGIIALFFAISCWGVYLSIQPLVANTHYYQAKSIASGSPYHNSLAIPYFEKALDWHDKEIQYHIDYAFALLDEALYSINPETKLHNQQKAEAALSTAISNEPQNATLYYNRAVLNLEFDPRVTNSIMDDLRKARELYPYYLRANRLLGEIEHHMGHYRNAIAASSVALQIVPNDIPIITILTKSFLAINKPQEAIDILQDAIDAHLRSADIYYLLGAAYEMDGDVGKAKAQYEAALEINNSHTDAAQSLAQLEND